MLFDFHTHGKLAKRLPFSTVYTDWLFGEAKNAGLDALCLTEHFNTLQFDELYGYLSARSTREGDALVLENGLRVFPGMETDIAEGGHILSIGPLEAILELNQRLAPHKAPGSFLPFAQLRDLFDQYPVVVGGAGDNAAAAVASRSSANGSSPALATEKKAASCVSTSSPSGAIRLYIRRVSSVWARSVPGGAGRQSARS